MSSQVFFCDLRASLKRPLNDKLDALMERVGLAGRIKKDGLAGIKIHFGEPGNTAFIRPVTVRRFVDAIRAAGGKPFLTDCNTLYVGRRADSAGHLEAAVANGFAYSVVGAPLIIADGLKGAGYRTVTLDLPDCKEAYIGADIVEADSLVSLAHFKGHEVSGIGGTIKNLGMGCAARRGKLFQHANIAPLIKIENCVACGTCLVRCPVSALKLAKRAEGETPPAKSDKPAYKAVRDPELCIGCGDCILACPEHAIEIPWDAQYDEMQRRMAAYTKAVLAGKEDRAVFFNFITNVSPACDCYPYQDSPMVADLGIMASTDPVAIDLASAELVNQAPGLASSCLKHAHAPGEDKFRDIYPNVNWRTQIDHAAEIGLGSTDYELVKVD